MIIRVAAILIRAGAPDILLVRTQRDARWMLPGGVAGVGERPSEAILRRLREKLGLSLSLNSEPDVVAVTRSAVNTVFRWGSIPANAELATQHSEAVEYTWVDREKVLSGAHAQVHREDVALLTEWDRQWKWDSHFIGTLYLEERESGSFVPLRNGRNA